MSKGWASGIVFAALLFLAPWPWYLFAVGGLLPVPLILLIAIGLLPSPILAAALAICAALGIAAFYFIARWFGRWSPRARLWAVGGMLGLLAYASFLPIYGGGENIMTPAGKFADAWTAYRNEVKLFSSLRADRTSPR